MNENQQLTNLKPKNKFWTFCWAFVPGAGQMYHGLFKKGISIMSLFFGVCAVAALLYMEFLLFALPVIWFYSFFDTLNRMNTPKSELSLMEDNFFFGIDFDKFNATKGFFEKRHIVFGVCVIAVGGFLFLREIWQMFAGMFDDRIYYIVRDAINALPVFIVPIICILLGMRLIMGGKKEEDEKDD